MKAVEENLKFKNAKVFYEYGMINFPEACEVLIDAWKNKEMSGADVEQGIRILTKIRKKQ